MAVERWPPSRRGPPPLTAEQKRAVRESLARPLGLVTGGPGTGKTTIVVAILRALAWAGVPMAQVAIAAPTGKAAQRLEESLGAGLSRAARDMADAALVSIAPSAQTIHRLLGWSPSAGRFSRHENDPLPSRVVIVDEASMIDLALMDRLFRALKPDARVVLLGDADQLPRSRLAQRFATFAGPSAPPGLRPTFASRATRPVRASSRSLRP